MQNEIRDAMFFSEFCTQGPKSWDSTCQICPLAPIHQKKRHNEGQRKEIYCTAQVTPWEEAELALSPLQPSLGYRCEL
jgi:hypothetical protein